MNIKEIRTFCQELIDLYDNIIQPITLQVKNRSCGIARYDKRILIIPTWIFKDHYPIEYSTAYVLHEIAHFINYDTLNAHGHHGSFREIEQRLLKDFGLIPKYSRAYIKQLSYENGETCYVRAW